MAPEPTNVVAIVRTASAIPEAFRPIYGGFLLRFGSTLTSGSQCLARAGCLKFNPRLGMESVQAH